jgi:hypothetical protein
VIVGVLVAGVVVFVGVRVAEGVMPGGKVAVRVGDEAGVELAEGVNIGVAVAVLVGVEVAVEVGAVPGTAEIGPKRLLLWSLFTASSW